MAAGKIVTVDEFDANPLAHPRCQRFPQLRPDLTEDDAGRVPPDDLDQAEEDLPEPVSVRPVTRRQAQKVARQLRVISRRQLRKQKIAARRARTRTRATSTV